MLETIFLIGESGVGKTILFSHLIELLTETKQYEDALAPTRGMNIEPLFIRHRKMFPKPRESASFRTQRKAISKRIEEDTKVHRSLKPHIMLVDVGSKTLQKYLTHSTQNSFITPSSIVSIVLNLGKWELHKSHQSKSKESISPCLSGVGELDEAHDLTVTPQPIEGEGECADHDLEKLQAPSKSHGFVPVDKSTGDSVGITSTSSSSSPTPQSPVEAEPLDPFATMQRQFFSQRLSLRMAQRTPIVSTCSPHQLFTERLITFLKHSDVRLQQCPPIPVVFLVNIPSMMRKPRKISRKSDIISSNPIEEKDAKKSDDISALKTTKEIVESAMISVSPSTVLEGPKIDTIQEQEGDLETVSSGDGRGDLPKPKEAVSIEPEHPIDNQTAESACSCDQSPVDVSTHAPLVETEQEVTGRINGLVQEMLEAYGALEMVKHRPTLSLCMDVNIPSYQTIAQIIRWGDGLFS
ncbi:hypothetical protein ADUPG1_008089 [Aduncisulcus paluster]|uniref:Uncharacterized protein n=1 Tax=Aduncisulcus paluster TaxID=2918883 RepID=A0ABQ5KQR1_9EUKA|nr:hypothetical protein ADUPG1_008089 [Aduncisulcus paluster]